MDAAPDRRSLVGEPISLDLLNTFWLDGTGRHDLLTDLPGLATWLSGHDLPQAPQSEPTRAALRAAREALRAHVSALAQQPADAAAVAALTAAEHELDAVLAHGVLVRTLRAGRPGTTVRVDDPSRLPAWTAVEDYLQLLARDPRRLRRCAGEGCVLHFYDTSKRGDRRWCSMAGCGNRAKAARHYARARRAPTSTGLTD